jgi:hypothetical protein
MKNTEDLIAVPDLYNKTDLIIHPNVGFDISLMNTKHPAKIFGNVTIEIFNTGTENFISGHIILSNKCEHDKIFIPNSLWKKIGSPDKVRLYYEDGKVLIACV